jgi:hypothetical protein
MKTFEQIRDEAARATLAMRETLVQQRKKQVASAVSAYRRIKLRETLLEDAVQQCRFAANLLDHEQFQEYAQLTNEIDAKEAARELEREQRNKQVQPA